jgi:hypothetical protein
MPKQKTKPTRAKAVGRVKNNRAAKKPEVAVKAAPRKKIEQSNTKASLSSLIKSSRDIMRKDAGLNGDLDRLPQLSWRLFLKGYDDLEIVREQDAIATRQKYKPIIPPPYPWRDWLFRLRLLALIVA